MFRGSATVAGVARGDVVVLDGPITVGGQVSGDVIAVHGSVRLLATAQVAGSVRAGGDVHQIEGAQVGGAIQHGVRFTLSGPLDVLGPLLTSAAMAVSILARRARPAPVRAARGRTRRRGRPRIAARVCGLGPAVGDRAPDRFDRCGGDDPRAPARARAAARHRSALADRDGMGHVDRRPGPGEGSPLPLGLPLRRMGHRLGGRARAVHQRRLVDPRGRVRSRER